MDDDGRSRGYGFVDVSAKIKLLRRVSRFLICAQVEIEVAADAERLIGEFHGSDVGGRDLIVRPGKQSGGDGGGGRGGGRGRGRGRGRGGRGRGGRGGGDQF